VKCTRCDKPCSNYSNIAMSCDYCGRLYPMPVKTPGGEAMKHPTTYGVKVQNVMERKLDGSIEAKQLHTRVPLDADNAVLEAEKVFDDIRREGYVKAMKELEQYLDTQQKSIHDEMMLRGGGADPFLQAEKKGSRFALLLALDIVRAKLKKR
jgi:hypothetical protein